MFWSSNLVGKGSYGEVEVEVMPVCRERGSEGESEDSALGLGEQEEGRSLEPGDSAPTPGEEQLEHWSRVGRLNCPVQGALLTGSTGSGWRRPSHSPTTPTGAGHPTSSQPHPSNLLLASKDFVSQPSLTICTARRTSRRGRAW